MSFHESIVEDAALEWFEDLRDAVGHGSHPAPDEPAVERDSFGELVLVGRLREAIQRLNPAVRIQPLATPCDTLPPKLRSGHLSVAGNEFKLEAAS
jgi:hypothetical protein